MFVPASTREILERMWKNLKRKHISTSVKEDWISYIQLNAKAVLVSHSLFILHIEMRINECFITRRCLVSKQFDKMQFPNESTDSGNELIRLDRRLNLTLQTFL